jgi:hypothetical protein
MITYRHVKSAGHKVKLAPKSPNTATRYCATCSGEVVRNRPGEREVLVDPLFPAGTRPTCLRCKERPVYLAGLCGVCYADWDKPLPR